MMFLKFKVGSLVLLSCFFVQADINLNRKLRSAVFENNLELIKKYLAEGADPNARDGGGNDTPLHWAQHLEAIKLLLEAGADPNARDNEGRTSLHKAAERGNEEIVVALLEAGADPNARDNVGQVPLVGALHTGIAKLLLEAGANPNVRTRGGETLSDLNDAVRAALALIEQESEIFPNDTSCKYISDYSKINFIQCGRRSLCMAEVSCKINIDDSHIKRTYQAVCTALANGDCPIADACVLDRSAVEENEQTDNNWWDSILPSSSRSSEGVR